MREDVDLSFLYDEENDNDNNNNNPITPDSLTNGNTKDNT